MAKSKEPGLTRKERKLYPAARAAYTTGKLYPMTETEVAKKAEKRKFYTAPCDENERIIVDDD